MLKAKLLSDKIVKEVNEYTDLYMQDDGKLSNTELSLKALSSILEKGFLLVKYIYEKNLHKQYPVLGGICEEIEKYMNKLSTTEENAKKLQLDSALQLWQQSKILIAFLACTVLDLEEIQ